jgi:hypothetical protein
MGCEGLILKLAIESKVQLMLPFVRQCCARRGRGSPSASVSTTDGCMFQFQYAPVNAMQAMADNLEQDIKKARADVEAIEGGRSAIE